MSYEQMSFDVTLESERELKENVNLAVEFACNQVKANNADNVVKNRHEGYGITSEQYIALSNSMKAVGDSMKTFLKVLASDDSKAIDATAAIYNQAIDVAHDAVKLAAEANRVMNDLYRNLSVSKTPMEEYLEGQEEEFEEAEEAADAEGND